MKKTAYHTMHNYELDNVIQYIGFFHLLAKDGNYTRFIATDIERVNFMSI